MASKSDSEQDFEEKWDDMAIVRAFEEALSDQHSRSSSSVKTSNRKQRAAGLQSNINVTTRNTTIDERDEELRIGDEHPAGRVGTCRQSNAEAHATGANPFASHQQQQSDLYQAAYAQAVCRCQPNHRTFRLHLPFRRHFLGFRQLGVQDRHPMQQGQTNDLANVLMAWYQSGYYTGRFQAMQELKLRGLR
ncbi:unnamed protein product [Peronospora destructor]|uniref:Survival motor neuron Tudor domain-containing protein n=1 Tax=Peronospora destructor TaxID=86335 RepID=A0AAV0V566_9STRA|nr:unnamed protein product [Peronospora destructor]